MVLLAVYPTTISTKPNDLANLQSTTGIRVSEPLLAHNGAGKPRAPPDDAADARGGGGGRHLPVLRVPERGGRGGRGRGTVHRPVRQRIRRLPLHRGCR